MPHHDAPFHAALESYAGICFNAGRGFSITTLLLVRRSRHDGTVTVFMAMFSAMSFDCPDSVEQVIGPLISRPQYDQVLDYIEIGKAVGALVAAGCAAAVTESEDYYVEPTFVNVDNCIRIVKDKVCGPVLAVISFEDNDDAVRNANDSKYGLGGAMQSADPGRALEAAKHIRSGLVAIDKSDYFGAVGPFAATSGAAPGARWKSKASSNICKPKPYRWEPRQPERQGRSGRRQAPPLTQCGPRPALSAL